MKMTPEQLEQTLQQMNARPIPAEHPIMPQLEKIFGEHTYFLDGRGLNIVERVDDDQAEAERGVVVNLASWGDADSTSLMPHEPEPTDQTVDLKPPRPH
jgi:hypothetical protein